MISAYRYIVDKRSAAKASSEAEANGVTSVHIPLTPLPVDPDTQYRTTYNELSPPPPATSQSPFSGSLKWKIMLMAALILPVFFETLDYTVVATAQVHIASVFNRLDLQSYVGTVYLLTSTVFLPLFASLADVWGRHWALQLSLAFFMVGSAISTGSHSMATMLVGRGIAGIGSAGMMAVVRIILSDSGSLDDNNWQQTMLFFLFTIGYCVGPVIGGALTTVSFRWIFAINLPCCLVAMILCFLILRGRVQGAQPTHTGHLATSTHIDQSGQETFAQKLLRIDWIGALLFMGAGITLLLALNWGSSAEWSSARVIACFVVSGVLYIVWVAWEYVLERKQKSARTSRNPLMRTDPMIPLELFKSRDLCIAQYATFVSGMVMIVMFYFISIFFTIVGGLTGTDAGTQLLYFAPGMGAGALISIRMLRQYRQPKPPIVIGSILLPIALGMISYGMDINSKGYVVGFLVMAGVGVGLSMGPLGVHLRFSQPDNRVAVVSALGMFSRALGGTVGLAQCGAVLNGKVNSIIKNLVTSGSLSAADAGVLANGLATGLSSLQSIESLPPDVQTIVRDAFQQGSRWSFISLVPWAALSVLLTRFLSDIRDTDQPDEAGPQQPQESIPEDSGKSQSAV